jgi:hypothetical protein
MKSLNNHRMENNQVTTTTEDALKQFLSTLIESKKLPTHIKTVEDAFTIAQMGKELGFPTMQAFHYIIPIQGKLSLSAKATNALLRKGGIAFVTVEDGVFTYGNRTEPTSPDQKPDGRRTTIKFVRDGMEEICSFTWRDAELQGLTTKDNWKRMPKEMLYARCLAKGANRIGADLLLGLYTAEEMADTFLKESDVRRNDDGTIAEIINVTATEVK